MQATDKVPVELLELLQRELRIVPVSSSAESELEFWRVSEPALLPERAEVHVGVKLAESLVYTWPDAFRIARPGVLEIVPEYMDRPLPKGDATVVRHALAHVSRVRGRLVCDGRGVAQLQVVAGSRKAVSNADGRFEIEGPFGGTPTQVFVAYKAQLTDEALPAFRPFLEIMDDFHVTRNWNVSKTPTISNGVAEFGDLALDTKDCRLWNLGIRALAHYFSIEQKDPPAGGLRIKRWHDVSVSISTPHTFYNYIVLPTDLAHTGGVERVFFHEFGHTLRFVADGSESHWHYDNFRFNYGHNHGSDLFNKGFAFSEGWAHYWSATVRGLDHSPGWMTHASNTPDDLDWDEHRIADRLIRMSRATSPKFMMDLQLANPGAFHTMFEFETAYCKALPGGSNTFCSDHQPLRPRPPSCPPEYVDDGATCRYNNVRTKPSSPRGAGSPPTSCAAGWEYDAGLCYPACPAGFKGVGPVCWQQCPAGYVDDGATCRRNARIISANNSACPAHDKCGLVTAKGCSVCPEGYKNDGCTCRIDAHVFGKSQQSRGVGQVPSACGAGMEYDAGLCYPHCPSGYNGVGPVCWGTCPPGFSDRGATCYRDPHVFSDDPEN